jgi:hypothetical protein
MIPGVEFDFGGGRVYLVPPLSLGALQLLQEGLTALPSLEVTDPKAVSTILEATHLALRRNYPEISAAEVGELVDLANLAEVYECVMDVAGVKRKSQAAERQRGNAPAESGQAGTDSSPPSAPTPAGPGTTSAST